MKLEYNHTSGMYEATVDGELIGVDSDVFAGEVADLQKMYMEGTVKSNLPPMDEDAAYDVAYDDLIEAGQWNNPPMHGLYINGVAQED